MTNPVPCPVCAGLSQPGHFLGWLGGWHHTTACTLRASQDGRLAGDYSTLWWYPTGFRRDATDTERTLLVALGVVWKPEDEPLQTCVSRRVGSQLTSVWPDATEPT